MPRLKIEKTQSYQVENEKGDYCITAYSRADAELIMKMAGSLPKLLCLKKGLKGKQPRGLYTYKSGFPIIEVYDPRLHRMIQKVKNQLTGDK